MIYATASRQDVPGIAQVFMDSFADSIAHVFGRSVHPALVQQVFRLCLEAEPEALFVAREGERVMGYLFAPVTLRRIWRAAVLRGHLFRWVANWMRGRYHIGFAPLRVLLLDKFHFLRSALGKGGGVEARILSLAVAEEARGRGVGTTLMRHAMAYLQRSGVAAVRLEVRPWNEPARRLYERMGFGVIDTAQDTQGPWLIMVWRAESGAPSGGGGGAASGPPADPAGAPPG